MFRNGGQVLELKLLGPPVMTVDGAPVVVDTRKATALLAYLAVSGEPHRRDALAGLLWPDADGARAAGALRRTLSAIRTAVGPQYLVADRASVGLVLDDVTVDVATARSLLASCGEHGHPAGAACSACLKPLLEVAALHRGNFLEGFALRDSAAFDDWQFFTGEELTRELASTLEHLVTSLVDAGRIAEAIPAARRRLALDPLHEPAHRELIRLYAWNDEHSAALRQYRECVRILDRELGVAPLQETTAVYEGVLEQRLQPPVVSADAAPQPVTSPAPADRAEQPSPFVGRADTQAELLQTIREQGDSGIVVVVEGEAGIGKTRLVAEVLERVGADGDPALVARSYPGEAGLAYGVIVEALIAAMERRGDAWLDALEPDVAGEVSRLLPQLSARRRDVPVPPSLDGPGARTRFVEALGRALATSVEATAPGILVFEDLHWADEASAEVLAHLARRIRGRSLVLILTWRSELVERGHPLRRLAADLRRDEVLTAVALERLSPPAVAEALGAFGLTDAGLADRVSAETEGLPLLVVEYARALVDDSTALDGPLPGGARDVLLARLDGVGEAASQILATAAVIGRSFDLDVVTEASGRTDDEVAGAVDELLARRLVAEIADGGAGPGHGAYDFTHAQLRRLAYDNATLARRRLLHRRVAAALENRTRRRVDDASAAVIAGHWAAAGDDAAAAQWEARAGAYAGSLLAAAEAITHFRTALALGHPAVAEIHERLGDLQTLEGRYTEAVASYESAAASAEVAAAARLEHKLGVVLHRNGRLDLAERHLERALVLVGPAPSALRGRIIADRGLNAYRRGDLDGATALAEQAATAAADAADAANLAQAANLLGLLARARGDLAEAREHLEHSLTLARDLNDAAAETSALNNLALAVSASGDADEALRLAGAALERSAAVGDRHREAALHNNIADLLRSRGDTDQAMAHLKQAVAIFAEVGEPGVLTPEVWQLVDW